MANGNNIFTFVEYLTDTSSIDLTQYKIVFYRGNVFEEAPADHTTPADNITVIEDSQGKRFIANRRAFPLGALSLKDSSDSTLPPEASRTEGDVYLVLPGTTGELSGFVNQIAVWTKWRTWFPITPVLGERIYVSSTDTDWRWNGSRWVEIPNIATGLPATTLDFPFYCGVAAELKDPATVVNIPNTYYLIANDATGVYVQHRNKIMHYTAAGAIQYIEPAEGMATFNYQTNTLKIFRQSNWQIRYEESTYVYRFFSFGLNNTAINSLPTKTYNGFQGKVIATLPKLRDLPAQNLGRDVYKYEVFAFAETHLDLTFTATARQREDVHLNVNLYKGTGADGLVATLSSTRVRRTTVSSNVSTYRSENRTGAGTPDPMFPSRITGDTTNYSRLWEGGTPGDRPREFRPFENDVTSADTLEIAVVASRPEYRFANVNTNASNFGIDWSIHRQIGE